MATDYQALFNAADAAGQAAAEAKVPTPMIVVQRANPFDDTSEVVKQYAPVTGGVCGFAWVTVKPGTAGFARWTRKQGLTRRGYYGGEQYWVSRYGQSMERKEAYAGAFAEVLREAGLEAYAGSRMD